MRQLRGALASEGVSGAGSVTWYRVYRDLIAREVLDEGAEPLEFSEALLARPVHEQVDDDAWVARWASVLRDYDDTSRWPDREWLRNLRKVLHGSWSLKE